eukprot:79887-Rhodomonas_salina.1
MLPMSLTDQHQTMPSRVRRQAGELTGSMHRPTRSSLSPSSSHTANSISSSSGHRTSQKNVFFHLIARMPLFSTRHAQRASFMTGHA